MNYKFKALMKELTQQKQRKKAARDCQKLIEETTKKMMDWNKSPNACCLVSDRYGVPAQNKKRGGK